MTAKNKKILVTGLFVFLIIAFALFASIAINAFQPVAADPNDPPQGDTSTLTDGGLTADIWQAIWVSPTNGQPYWATAPKPISAASILGSKDGDNFAQVATLENSVWMKLSQPVNSWIFTAKETITVTNAQGTTVKTIANQAPLNINGDTATANSNIQVTGAWLTGDQLEDIISLPPGTYHFVVTLSDINLQADNSNLSATSITDENTLSWSIRIE